MDTIYIRSFSRLKRALFKLHYLHAICTFIKKLLIDWQNDKVNLDFIQFVNLGLAFWLFSKDVFVHDHCPKQTEKLFHVLSKLN